MGLDVSLVTNPNYAKDMCQQGHVRYATSVNNYHQEDQQ